MPTVYLLNEYASETITTMPATYRCLYVWLALLGVTLPSGSGIINRLHNSFTKSTGTNVITRSFSTVELSWRRRSVIWWNSLAPLFSLHSLLNLFWLWFCCHLLQYVYRARWYRDDDRFLIYRLSQKISAVVQTRHNNVSQLDQFLRSNLLPQVC